ncbi:vesicle-associated membrane protein-associated protein A isoform X2 [Eupeodes corollae]|uniref:vesicle-associated membrane protein-associated protein A isoform X2 n=1 Tax=Eupeodes corollae TaxID=290404 RepID=UPI00249126EF|nr:vesicle-associated membrane protein-associated protein A isoform X2 [Eupeodes corollae]
MLNNKKELLVIDPPNELRFRGPFTKPVISVMKLTNPTEDLVLFKIKTTAPKKYCVRPNFGHVTPHTTIRVEICLQAFVYDPNEKNKHKFMVQSLVVPEGVDDFGKLWKEVEPDNLMDAKLKCVFEMPAEASEADNSAPKEVVTNEASPIPASEEKQNDNKTEQLLSEIRQLKNEGSELREENLTLKNHLMRIKYTTSQQRMDEPYSPTVEKQIPLFYIALSIVTAIFGIFLGKYLL